MKMSEKESLKKDKEYLKEILELYDRNIFSDYIIGLHFKPITNAEEDFVEIAKAVKMRIPDIKIAYIINDNIVFYLSPFSDFGKMYRYRLQEILSHISAVLNKNTENIMIGNIYGLRNISVAIKLMQVLQKENELNIKKEWIENKAKEIGYQLTGNMARDELKIASKIGEGFETIPLDKLNGYLITDKKIIPNMKYSQLVKIFENFLLGNKNVCGN